MPRPLRITPLKIKIYDYIVRFKTEHDGNSPTIRQIGDEVGLSSTSVVNHQLDGMARLGMISRGGKGEGRMIKVKGGTWAPPATVKPEWTVTQ